MNITLPDKSFKLIISIGLLLIVTANFMEEKAIVTHRENNHNIKSELDSVDHAIAILNNELKNKKFKDSLSEVINEFKLSEDLEERSKLDKNIAKLEVIGTQVNQTKESITKIELLKQKMSALYKDGDSERNNLMFDLERSQTLTYLGLLFFVIGLRLWWLDEDSAKRKEGLLKVNEIIYPRCQSCGEKFNAIKFYGKKIDGNDNLAFCKDCYQDGAFTNPLLTKEELLISATENIEDKYGFTKKRISLIINSLDRWKTDKYT
jgi:hypothetical protein